MRTTLNLPGDLLKRSKTEAADRGISLGELVSQALTKELERSSVKPVPGCRIRFPLFSSLQPGSLELRNADIAYSESEEDRRRGAIPV